ncbi:phosphoglycolate phosphatase [Paraburkholderia phenazinium]|jgi:phosphoglycolate phosphatase|uniref:Phosphoglycolate phosphatase n=2 Tax=Burkholderiaceae TaxID=119060 RepID=A0A1N6F7D7_9BURK|nr:phosphoglycolate phosphatase [Paraburkholderia phenazinium]
MLAEGKIAAPVTPALRGDVSCQVSFSNRSMAIKLAIFDFDGTLADTFPLFIDSINGLAVRHDFRQVEHHEVDRLRSMGAREILRDLRLPVHRVPRVLLDFRALMQQRSGEIRPFAGIAQALQSLADRQVMLALATSNSLANVEAVLGEALVERFAAVECSSGLFGKAHRLRRILQATRVERTDAIYIGDEIRDAHAARKIGIRFGAVGWGYTDFAALTRMSPDAAFNEPGELTGLADRS